MCYIRPFLLLFFLACPIPFLQETLTQEHHYHGNSLCLRSTWAGSSGEEIGSWDPAPSSWQSGPSAQDGMDKMLTRAFIKTKDPCNLWGHKNTHNGKKRNKFFDIHTWNTKITDHPKRNSTGIKQRLWYTGLSLDRWSETYVFCNTW